jgi:hypothetical protein
MTPELLAKYAGVDLANSVWSPSVYQIYEEGGLTTVANLRLVPAQLLVAV